MLPNEKPFCFSRNGEKILMGAKNFLENREKIMPSLFREYFSFYHHEKACISTLWLHQRRLTIK